MGTDEMSWYKIISKIRASTLIIPSLFIQKKKVSINVFNKKIYRTNFLSNTDLFQIFLIQLCNTPLIRFR